MGLFDVSESGSGVASHFDLEKVPPLSFEERMKWEKAIIGYPVSGHPLDGIEEFVRKKSKNISMIYEWIEKKSEVTDNVWAMIDEISTSSDTLWSMAEQESAMKEAPPRSIADSREAEVKGVLSLSDGDLPAVLEDEWLEVPGVEKVREESVFATLIGLVHDVRKMQTKSGGMMLMATVESVGFDFKLVVFPRDYETYEKKVIEDMIVVVYGRLKFDTERDEISISPGGPFGKKHQPSGSIKSFSISEFHEFAEYSPFKSRVPKIDLTSAISHLQSRYSIDVPAYWNKSDLLDLRDYLEKAEMGLTPVWIRIHGLEKDTKFSVADVQGLEEWVRKKGV